LLPGFVRATREGQHNAVSKLLIVKIKTVHINRYELIELRVVGALEVVPPTIDSEMITTVDDCGLSRFNLPPARVPRPRLA
jgi:hypothetical protein